MLKPLFDTGRVPLCVKIREVNVSRQEARMSRILVNHFFISSISCGEGPAVVQLEQRRAENALCGLITELELGGKQLKVMLISFQVEEKW